jgi:DAK2 domain fusion protein YloV|tara:strand:+ start:24785 stop:26374 length:1590 start_codon:yes stop_codon:yes gene_type:complete
VATKDNLSAVDLASAFLYATEWLGVFTDEINALNVYPVPDGDTGTNMHLTMQSVRRELNEETISNFAQLAHALAYGSLLGARGNSGVILSQVLKGFSESIKSCNSVGPTELKLALSASSKAAYAAVIEPVEGTILTVVRKAAEEAQGSRGATVEVLRSALEAARAALKETPEQLEVLKQAGVVDAGGLGYVRLLEGLIAFQEGTELPLPPIITRRAQEQFEEEEFGFCTEFLLSEVEAPTKTIQEIVRPFGDSLLVVGAEGFVKGHIHTEDPERLLATVAKFGKMVRAKVEDMSEQHSEILAGAELSDAEPSRSGLVTVSSGYGITKVFRGLGARVVGGGQTDNPSVEDIADAVRSVGADQVIVLPNNKNIVMAAERVTELLPDKEIYVIPTNTLGAGLAAAVLFQENQEASSQIDEMRAAANLSLTIEITVASRDADIDDISVKEGQAIGLVNGELQYSDSETKDCLLGLLRKIDLTEFEIGTLFFSAGSGLEVAQELLEKIEKDFPELEMQLLSGAPDLYPYLLVLE